MSKFFIDTEDFSAEECDRLCLVLEELAEGDVPLVLELLLVDEKEIQTLNREQRGIDKITDVLSFPALEGIKGQALLQEEHETDLDEEGRILIGSIVICKKRAEEQAIEYGHSYERELYYLAVHGVLHCLGYDHEMDEQRAEMRAKEESVMQKLNLTRGL